MRIKRKLNRGRIIWDVSANREFVRTFMDCGFNVKCLPHSDVDGLSDEQLATRYAKGRFPVCTSDRKAASGMYSKKGAVGIIVIESSRREYLEQIKNHVFTYFKSITVSDLRGKVVYVTKDGVTTETL